MIILASFSDRETLFQGKTFRDPPKGQEMLLLFNKITKEDKSTPK